MKKKFLYIASSPSFNKDEIIKIGITNNPVTRLKALRGENRDPLFEFRAVFKFKNKDYPEILECGFISHFYQQQYQKPYFCNKSYNWKYKKKSNEYFTGNVEDFYKYAINNIPKCEEYIEVYYA